MPDLKFVKQLLFALIVMLSTVVSFISCTKIEPEKQGLLAIDLVDVDFITQSSATFKGDIFGEIDLVDSMGFCWGIDPRPTINDNIKEVEVTLGLFSMEIESFQPENRYFGRAYYFVEGEVFYSNVINFDIPTTVSDNQGNEYKTVKIGNQLWMAENLRVTRYNNGDPITDGTGFGNYSAMRQPKLYFNYNDAPANVAKYGRLYTWFVIADERGVCPPGWSIPDINDWQKLSTHLDALTIALSDLGIGQKEMSAVSGGMMKTEGTIESKTGIWKAPNGGATNISNLSIVPAGLRDPSGAFDGLGYNAAFWSLTSNDDNNAQMFYCHFFNEGFFTNSFDKKSGYSVRCIKNVN